MHLLRSILLLFVPGVIFFAALYLSTRMPVSVVWQGLLSLFPALTFAAGLLLGWRFNRTRVLWAIALLILVERVLALRTPFDDEYLMSVAPLIVPVNLVLFSWWSERGLVTLHGLLRLVILLLQVGALYWLYIAGSGDVIALLSRPLLISPGSINCLSRKSPYWS